MNTNNKLALYLDISEKAKELADIAINKISEGIQQSKKLTWREKVIFALARKSFSTFECLEEDAKKDKGEAQHHLKTLVECFLYYHWVAEEESDTNAKMLLAKGCKEKISFFKENPNYLNDTNYCEQWEEFKNNLTHGLEERWKKFSKKTLRNIIDGSNVEGFYKRVYKLACEPAHISDLLDYLPPLDGTLTLKQPSNSKLRSIVASDYGLYIVLCFLDDASDYYNLGLKDNVSSLKDYWAEARGGLPSG